MPAKFTGLKLTHYSITTKKPVITGDNPVVTGFCCEEIIEISYWQITQPAHLESSPLKRFSTNR